jgi:hypothetical protein
VVGAAHYRNFDGLGVIHTKGRVEMVATSKGVVAIDSVVRIARVTVIVN